VRTKINGRAVGGANENIFVNVLKINVVKYLAYFNR
jgi:hypothetical protein